MIQSPLNDHTCLGAITDLVRELVAKREPALLALAHELGTPAAVIRWIRSLPQRDDLGQPDDGPRIDACAPPQRLRLPAPDPNCVERGSLFCVLAEFLDPATPRRLATIDTPLGRHTLPVERDRPVVLDPRVPRNSARAGVDVAAATPLPTDLANCAAWVCGVAAEPAHQLPGGPRRLRNGQAALAAVASGTPVACGLADDVATVLALAAREAPLWGPAGLGVVDRVAKAVVELADATGDERRVAAEHAPRNVSFRIGRYRLRPAIPEAVGAVLRTLGAVGLEAGTAVARAQLASLGVTPGMLGVLERELNRDGLSLGPLGRPAPPIYSFAAMSRDALVARHLERAGAA
ncbi:MAG: hypothetical protein IPL61_12605 [Myxococcales bacterium]|nr:hypothetical protein [Myxococcales bacterium]